MSVKLSPVGGVAAQFFSDNGEPLSGGLIYTYYAGTSTPLQTYSSSTTLIQHTNPIVLDAAGRVPSGVIWLEENDAYKFILRDSANNLIGTYDYITGINSEFQNYSSYQEIQTASAGQTVFNLNTMSYTPGNNNLSVFVDGVNQYGPGAQFAYFETDSNTVTFLNGLHDGALVKFTTAISSNIGVYNVADADQITYDPPYTGSVITNVENKLGQFVTVKDFGAVGDGLADDTNAIQDMITAVGFAQFSIGNYLCSTTTLDAPLVFLEGAYLTVLGTQTVTITDSIESSKQWIFRGAGNYVLQNDPNSGENARQIHVSWFGAFPTKFPTDQAPAIQKAITAMGNARESVIDFDVGNYYVGQSMSVTRGCWIRGSGSRRTLFNNLTDGFTTFVTTQEACRFSNIQFENRNQATTIRTSPYIRLNHNYCDIYDIKCGRSFRSIEVNSNSNRIDNIIWLFDTSAGAVPVGSSIIAIRGANNTIQNIFGFFGGIYGPTSVVHLGANVSSGFSSANTISNISSSSPSIQVWVDSTDSTIRRTIINNITCNQSSGAAPEAVVKISTSGTGGINSVYVNGVVTTSAPSSVIVINQGSSNTTKDIVIDGVIGDVNPVSGISITRTNGVLTRLTFGDDIQLSDTAVPFLYSGDYTQLKVSPLAIPDAQTGISYGYNINDDAYVQIDLSAKVFTGLLAVTSQTVNYGLFVSRAANSPAVTTISASANVTAVATTFDPNITSAYTDGLLTVVVNEKVIYLVNRLGASQRMSASLFTGDISS